MKRILLTLSVAASAFAANAQQYDFPTLADSKAYSGKYAPVNAPIAISSNGTVFQTGLYDQMVMIGNDILENIATSAFVSAIDPSSPTPKWSAGIMGAAQIKAITATDDAVFVAGTFADDVIIGSKTFTGTPFSHNMVNAFVAKYALDGSLIAAESIIPHKVSAYADLNNEQYDSDLAVTPTAIAVLDGKVYVSVNYLGGYNVGDISIDGTLKSSFGYYDNMCVGIISFSESNLQGASNVFDCRNADAININGLGPQSICIATDGKEIFAGIFTSGVNILNINGTNQEVAFKTAAEEGDDTEYGAIMVRINEGKAVKIGSNTNERILSTNVIKKMQVADGKLYISGSVAKPLPFMPSLEPDLWTDQFAACLSTADFSTVWASITGAKREDMKDMYAKYRECTDATFDGSKYIVAGSTNFTCDATGSQSPYESESIIGIANLGATTAVATSTAEGSKLTISAIPNAINVIKAEADKNAATYDISGRKINGTSKNQVYIKSGKKYFSK